MKRAVVLGVSFAALFAVLPAFAATKTLPDEVVDAILIALDDEYHAEAIYTALIEEFGENTAFVNIMEAEQTHADQLIALLEKYDIGVPENGYLDGTLELEELPDTLEEAYEAGILGEIVNIALYEDELLPIVADYKDVTNVFTSLMTASATHHLPTFTQCATGDCQDDAVTGTGSKLASASSRDTGSGGQKSKSRERERERSSGKASGSGQQKGKS